jgi:proline dehydrogenase
MGILSFLARRFVAGEKMDEAVSAVQRLNEKGLSASLDILGESVTDRREAERAADEYHQLLRAIRDRGIRSHVSLKLSQMGLAIEPEFCASLVRGIVARAGEFSNFVRIDMEGSAWTGPTLDLHRRLFRDHPNVGIVLQSYLERSEADARELAVLRAPVRVCKGAYKEPLSVASHDIEEIRGNFRRIVGILLKGGSHTAIATHDESLIRWAIDWTGREGIPKDRFEFQMLYGIRRRRASELASMGYAVRAYVPYGTHWLPYFMRRIRERKENALFVLKGLVSN